MQASTAVSVSESYGAGVTDSSKPPEEGAGYRTQVLGEEQPVLPLSHLQLMCSIHMRTWGRQSQPQMSSPGTGHFSFETGSLSGLELTK